ncbi:MAG: TonB-dependent receptor [bacterium]|nr:TonB-dependent receptor [bacterium]
MKGEESYPEIIRRCRLYEQQTNSEPTASKSESLWKAASLYIILILFLHSHLCIPLLAEEQDELDLRELIELPLEELLNIEVSGTSRFAQKTSEAPASTIVITAKQIVERGYRDLSEVLSDLPGFDISANSGRFGEFYTIRGIDGNDRFLVLIDGAKINPYSGTFLSLGNSLSIRFVKQIEIIYGPASALYGADAFSGIINIVTKSTRDVSKKEMTLYGSYGSFNSFDAGMSLHMPIKKGKEGMISFFGRMFNSDGLDLVGRDPVYDVIEIYESPLETACQQPVRDYNIFIKTEYKNLRFSFFRQRFDQGNAPGMVPKFYVFNETNRWALTTDIIRGSYRKELPGRSDITVDLSYTRHEQDPDTQFHKFNLHQYMTGKDKTFKAVVTFKKAFGKGIKTVVGAEYENTKSIPAYANDHVLDRPLKYEGENKRLIDDELTVKETRASLFAEVLIKPIRNLRIFSGVRYDYSLLNQDTVNPRIGAIYKPARGTTLKLLYGTAFQAPSLFYKYEQFGAPTVLMLPNDSLENQELKTYEFCLIKKLGKYALVNFSLYYNDLENLIVRKLLPGQHYNKYFGTYTAGIKNTNIGRQIGKGFNLTLDYVFNGKLKGYSYYSFTEATFNITGEKALPRVSKHKVCAGLTYTGVKGLCISPRLKWVGPMNTTVSNPLYAEGERQPGNIRVDLYVSYKGLIPGTRIFARFGNIFDSDIKHAGIFGQSGVYEPLIYQPRFNCTIGFEMELKK